MKAFTLTGLFASALLVALIIGAPVDQSFGAKKPPPTVLARSPDWASQPTAGLNSRFTHCTYGNKTANPSCPK
jgi:hypothetical protein